jgi:hypothetical protein
VFLSKRWLLGKSQRVGNLLNARGKAKLRRKENPTLSIQDLKEPGVFTPYSNVVNEIRSGDFN